MISLKGESVKKKPETVSEYVEWLKEKHNVEIKTEDETYYYTVANKVKLDLVKSNFWIELMGNIRRYDQEFQLSTGYPLFIPNFEPNLDIKSFESFLLKTFRKNVLENNLWPDEPENGWILPNNWFSKIQDIVRTLFIVKYFDGVDFFISKIDSICKHNMIPCKVFYEAREEGYYAAHLYLQQSFEIPRVTWDTERVIFSIEVQITTQLQEVIRRLLHTYYEKRRRMARKPLEKWQWDYKSDEFCVSYLGHILHYVEGMIMEIREKQKEKTL